MFYANVDYFVNNWSEISGWWVHPEKWSVLYFVNWKSDNTVHIAGSFLAPFHCFWCFFLIKILCQCHSF